MQTRKLQLGRFRVSGGTCLSSRRTPPLIPFCSIPPRPTTPSAWKEIFRKCPPTSFGNSLSRSATMSTGGRPEPLVWINVFGPFPSFTLSSSLDWSFPLDSASFQPGCSRPRIFGVKVLTVVRSAVIPPSPFRSHELQTTQNPTRVLRFRLRACGLRSILILQPPLPQILLPQADYDERVPPFFRLRDRPLLLAIISDFSTPGPSRHCCRFPRAPFPVLLAGEISLFHTTMCGLRHFLLALEEGPRKPSPAIPRRVHFVFLPVLAVEVLFEVHPLSENHGVIRW